MNSHSVARMALRPLTVLAVVAGIGWGGPAAADQRIRCESVNDRQNYCAADTRGGVRLARQISNSDCTEGRSWGYDRRGIWVSEGCRAEFIVFEPRGRPDPYDDRGGWDHGRGDGGGYGGGGYGGGYDGGGGYGRGPREDVRVRCESRNNRYTSCRIDIGHGRVELVRQFSDDDCSYNRNWGYDRRQIWVDDGCRAEFVIVR